MKYRINRSDLAFMLAAVFMVGLLSGIVLAPANFVPERRVSIAGLKTVEMGIPAVDTDGNGVVGTLRTTVRPGTGQVLVNVNSVLAQFDTQLSGRTAAKAATDFAKADLNSIDIIYDISVNASVIEGPSAGAAMATSIVLALEDIPDSKSIMMTGTIRGAGSIGPVGAVPEKAAAAKDFGATTFLVPVNQSSELKPNRLRQCTVSNGIRVCKVTYDYDKVSIGSNLNITVSEVRTIGDAVEFFKKQSGNSGLSI